MTIKDYEDLVAERKKSLTSSQKLFRDVVAVSSVTTGTVIASPQENEERKQKIYYMVVALVCSEWESFYSQIYFSDVSKHQAFTGKVYKGKRVWCTKELKEVGHLRDCIMHHGGKVDGYCSWMKNERGQEIKFPPKYLDPSQQKIYFSSDKDIDEFFKIVRDDGLDHVLERIRNHIGRNKPSAPLWQKVKKILVFN